MTWVHSTRLFSGRHVCRMRDCVCRRQRRLTAVRHGVRDWPRRWSTCGGSTLERRGCDRVLRLQTLVGVLVPLAVHPVGLRWLIRTGRPAVQPSPRFRGRRRYSAGLDSFSGLYAPSRRPTDRSPARGTPQAGIQRPEGTFPPRPCLLWSFTAATAHAPILLQADGLVSFQFRKLGFKPHDTAADSIRMLPAIVRTVRRIADALSGEHVLTGGTYVHLRLAVGHGDFPSLRPGRNDIKLYSQSQYLLGERNDNGTWGDVCGGVECTGWIWTAAAWVRSLGQSYGGYGQVASG